MEIISRVKGILVSPKPEWQTIEAENDPHVKVFTTYVVPLALIPAIASFIGYGIIGYSVLGIRIGSISLGLSNAITQYLTMLGGIYLSAFVIDALANNFGAKKDFNRTFSLVAYSYTPMFVAGIFNILPALAWLATLVGGVYTLYLLYIGLQPMTKVPAEKQTGFFIISLIAIFVAYFILAAILGLILAGIFGASLMKGIL